MNRFPQRALGFSLLEMTVVLVVSSILAATMYAYFGRSVTHGYVPLASLQSALDLSTAMENLTSDYRRWIETDTAPPWRPETIYQPGDRVRAPGRKFGHLFACIEEDGISGASEPTWENVPGNIVVDGTTRWRVLPGQLDGLVQKISMLADDGGPGDLDGVVQDYEYGRYGIHFLEFIRLLDGVERAIESQDPRNLLKVVLVNDAGERFTLLLTTSY
ncbi:MAG: Tfp pilus assembly protein FimT/FimU [Desulfococcaceae bacterium]